MLVAFRTALTATIFFAGLGGTGLARAQGADTLARAQQLSAEKAFAPAAALLERYERTHPTNTDAVRLHLQLLYWLNRLPEAGELYQRASRQQPGATSLRLDYGRMLYEKKQYPQAQAVLVPLLQQEPGNVEALTMLGIMRYYEGRVPQAMGYLHQVLAAYPDNPTAKAFAQQIKKDRAPYVLLATTYRTDDQPLTWLETKLEAGSYRSALLSPTVQAVLWNTRDSVGGFRQHVEVRAGNKTTLLHQKLTVQLNAGVFKHAGQPAPAFVGSAMLRYQLPKGFGLEATGSRSPYFFTIASSRAAALYGQVVGALLFQSSKGWQGRAQATEAYLPGSNRILGLSAWGLSRALALGPVYLKGGYSFAYNDARYNTYAPVLALPQLAASGGPVAGTYGAYFTPSRQLIHSLLAQADARAGSRCWLSLKASVGVYTKAENPYLFLTRDAAGLAVGRGFYTEHYTPLEVKAQASYSATRHLGLEGGYGYTKAFFYAANQVFTNLKYSF